jgi:hypothetical protein
LNGTQWNDVGLAGANGADGNAWFLSDGVPSNSVGKPSDFYLFALMVMFIKRTFQIFG